MKNNESDIFNYLITNKGFRDWVQKPNDVSNYFWKKWIEEHPENIQDLKKAREFIERIRFKNEKLSNTELDELLGKIIKSEKPVYYPITPTKRVDLFRVKQWLKVAAILWISVIAAVVTNNFSHRPVEEEPALVVTEWRTVKNPKGRKSKVTLPDGTLVNLNYESELKFPKVFDGDIRKVELVGEAFFDVVPNDTLPFVVKTGIIETEVLGTSFNINSFEWENNTDVSLVTGKVRIRRIDDATQEESIYLTPGQQLTYNKNSREIEINSFDVENTLAWKYGIIIFKDTDFEEFIDRLERWYGVDFQIYGSPSRKWKVNGRYQDQKLDDILIGLKFVYDIDYKIQGKNVTLKFK